MKIIASSNNDVKISLVSAPTYNTIIESNPDLNIIVNTGPLDGGHPAGSANEVQFRDNNGVFAADTDFTYNRTSKTLSLAGNISGVKTLSFNTTQLTTPAVGQLGWNTDDNTLDLGLPNGVTLQIGQEQHIYARNDNGNITNGQAVAINGVQGQRIAIMLANNTGSNSASHAIGLATQNIHSNNSGFVTVFGLVRNIQTPAGSVEGDIVYLGATPGSLTLTRPPAPAHSVRIGYVVKPSSGNSNNGSIFVDVQVGEHLEYLHDVTITTPVAGQTLIYNGNLWVNGNTTKEKVVAHGNTSGTITPDYNAGTIHSYTLTGNLTLNSIDNIPDGASITVLLKQDNNGNHLLTSTMLYEGASKTLSTAANATDVIKITFINSIYYAILYKEFA